MLAYVFWHRAAGAVDAGFYERRLAAFHGRLRDDPPPGFRGSAAFRVGELPWLGGPGGYEDWYLVDGWDALGALNAAAVDAAHARDHDAVANQAGDGAGGVYAPVAGALALRDSGAAEWWGKPRVVGYGQFERELTGDRPAGEFALWQRQLVLGPAPEFCLLTRGSERVRVA